VRVRVVTSTYSDILAVSSRLYVASQKAGSLHELGAPFETDGSLNCLVEGVIFKSHKFTRESFYALLVSKYFRKGYASACSMKAKSRKP
jgi:hypothetical protein